MRRWLLAAAIAGVTATTFAPVREFQFVNYDDGEFVSANPHVTGGLTREGARWAFAHAYDATGGPITWLSHMLDVERAGLDAGPHHATNLVLHAVDAVVLFLVLAATTRAEGRSAFAAALFALHPLHVESVAWVAARKDPLSTLFWLLTMAAYVWYVRRPGRGRYAVVVLLFAAGLLSKPIVAMLPLVLLLLDVWPLGRFASGARRRTTVAAAVVEKLPLAALSAACLAVTFASQQRIGAVMDVAALPVPVRLAHAALAACTYLGKTLWPSGLIAFYPYRTTVPIGLTAAATIGLAAITSAALSVHRRAPYVTVGWLWYLVTLAPVIGIVQVGGHGLADRATYLPLIGIFIAVSWAGAAVLQRARWSWIAQTGVALLIVAACAVAARAQTRHWRDSQALWEHAIAVDPGNARAHANLGVALADRGDRHRAAEEYETALRLQPLDPRSHSNLALILAETGRTDDAIGHYREALRLDPRYAHARINLANLLDDSGRSAEAVSEYGVVLRDDPDNVLARANLAMASAKAGDIDGAIAGMREVLRRDPADAQWHYVMAMMWMQKDRTADAMTELEAVLRIDPRHRQAQSALETLRRR